MTRISTAPGKPAYGGGHGANQRAEQRGDQDRDDPGQ